MGGRDDDPAARGGHRRVSDEGAEDAHGQQADDARKPEHHGAVRCQVPDLSHGYAVYIMDQVGRGRSPYVESVYGEKNPKAPKFVDLPWVNKWHERRAYARMRLDDARNLYFEMYVNCVGGVTRDNIISNLSMYEQHLKNLKGTK